MDISYSLRCMGRFYAHRALQACPVSPKLGLDWRRAHSATPHWLRHGPQLGKSPEAPPAFSP
eukprot:scaffold105392_cov30-Tisochrysis_lutea.AAC.4